MEQKEQIPEACLLCADVVQCMHKKWSYGFDWSEFASCGRVLRLNEPVGW
jgi:hypothetical protein